MFRKSWGGLRRAFLASGLCFGLASASNAATIVVVDEFPGAVESVDALTGFMTTGALMGGMRVTAFFSDETESTAVWMPTGADSGQAVGSGFMLSQSGDTFTELWTLTNTRTDETGLTGIIIDAFPGNTVFDRTFGGVEGTPGSAAGKDFDTDYEIAGLDIVITATYIGQVALTGFAPVGDLFRYLDIILGIQGGLLPTDDPFTFVADTDNGVGPRPTSEPGTLLLLGAGLAAAWHRRRRRS